MLEKYWEKQEVKAKELFESIRKKISKDEVDRLGRISMDSMIIVSEKEKYDLIMML
jgi:hypothetical protein